MESCGGENYVHAFSGFILEQPQIARGSMAAEPQINNRWDPGTSTPKSTPKIQRLWKSTTVLLSTETPFEYCTQQ